MNEKTISAYLEALEKEHTKGHDTEHTHRPAFKNLFESLCEGLTATNEPKRIACGAPDFIVSQGNVPIGYIETKDIGLSLDQVEKSDQLKRYREALQNLILTNYLEFRLYIGGELKLEARLAREVNGKFKPIKEGGNDLGLLLQSFMAAKPPEINNSHELADKMARLARLIREIITKALDKESERGSLHQQMDGFREVLLHDLTEAQFADMYAQTICYGLFTARCYHKQGDRFTRRHAPHELPKTNPFLRKLFSHVAGVELDDRVAWAVDDLAELLDRAQINAILRDFGRRTRQEDPVIHFYESFLAAYDPRMREARGVYYTPEPVVSYIVRSVDHLLKEEFGLTKGLADESTVRIQGDDGKDHTVHKVQILDPATGTGTFLKEVISHIHESFARHKGAWPGYVADHLLPRMYGFELLMAPYAVAHMKVGLQLLDSGYDFAKDQRLQIYLTNSLEEQQPRQIVAPFTQWLTEEALAANRVKKEAPVMVVLGNPPYSGHSANIGEWIADLLKGKDSLSGKKTGNYFEVDGAPLGERNPKWLNDDYVKFIRFAQWRIERTGHGVLAFITNHGYLDNPTFRGMRQSLMDTFDDIYILDLHGNAKKKETAPDGGKDENVFDIQQGVAIGIFVKKGGVVKKLANVHHAELWGLREVFSGKGDDKKLASGKYHWLYAHEIKNTKWKTLKPSTPFYLFIPHDTRKRKEYEVGWKVNDIFPVNSVGVVTARDDLTIAWSSEEIYRRTKKFISLPPEEARLKYDLGPDARDWKVELAQDDLNKSGISKDKITPVLYRPFDVRYTYYTGRSRGFICMPRPEVMRHMMAGENLGVSTTRSTEIVGGWEHIFCTRDIVQHHTVSLKEVNYLFPLYLYPNKATNGDMFKNGLAKHTNLAPEFIEEFGQKLYLKFIPDGVGDLKKTFGPEDVFHYIYAIFHSPEYRKRYAEFLKMDFPRVPLTGNVKLFRKLCDLGAKLTAFHLLEDTPRTFTTFPETGSNEVEAVRYDDNKPGKVWINKVQYFENIPSEVWEFQIGGYQVMQKWLKDRKGRSLAYDDIQHYCSIAAALKETIRLMAEVDDIINGNGGWPIQ
ncbi:MAG: N-6 DNA methylase [Nitrospinae bacterium]|nr:N-6 DNA methylase [Nitrospinota bacterium]